MQNLVFVSHAVCVHVGGPKILRVTGACPLWTGMRLTPLETCYSPTCYHTKSRRCRSNRLSIIVEICQKILTPCILPFKVIKAHWNWHRSLGYPWLPISVP